MINQSSYKNYLAGPTHQSPWKVAIAVSFVLWELVKKQRRQRWSVCRIRKCRQNFWTKGFQQTPHNAYIENSTESPDFQCVCNSSNRHTHTKRLPQPSRMHRGLINLIYYLGPHTKYMYYRRYQLRYTVCLVPKDTARLSHCAVVDNQRGSTHVSQTERANYTEAHMDAYLPAKTTAHTSTFKNTCTST